MTETMHFNGYDGSVLFDSEENLFHGRVLGIRDFVLFDGNSREELATNFHDAVNEYLRFCREDGKKPGTPFENLAVRVSPEVHRRASLFAQEHDLPFDSLVETALSEYLAHTE